jgi:exopolyphosphatase/guanosine-5'-triphosphate,3'-diphosphate pyrophosphatase
VHLTAEDREIVANIACLHRLPYPDLNMEHCARLKAEQQLMVRRLAPLLRVADALDESGRHVVQAVRAYEESGVVFIDLHAVPKARQEREAVLRKADMFEQVYLRPVVVERNRLEKKLRRALASHVQHPHRP